MDSEELVRNVSFRGTLPKEDGFRTWANQEREGVIGFCGSTMPPLG